MSAILNRLKILALLQISNKHKLKKPENLKLLFAKIFIRIFFMVLITAACAGLTILLVDIIGIPKDANLLTFFIVLLQLFSIFACTMGLLENLYTSKDNPILLAYPALPNEVFISKLLVYYIYEIIRSFNFFLPFFIGFGFALKLLSPAYILTSLLMTAVLPLFPVLIGALVTIPLVFLKRFLNVYALLKFLLTMTLLAGLFVLLVRITNLLPDPIRILAMYDVFVEKMKSIVIDVNKWSLFYKFIGNIFFKINVASNLLIVFGILLTLFILIVFISRPFYFKMASRSSEHANLKAHKQKNKAHSNTFLTFLRKEWILTIRNPGEFINNYSFIIALPYVFYLMMSIFVRVDRNELGNIMTVTFSMLIALVMATASNTASAMAVTGEGQEFVLLKTAPGKTSNMAWAKILFNLVFSSFMIIFSYLLFMILAEHKISKPDLYLMMFSTILINSGMVFWSFQIDMLNPRLREFASTGALAHTNNYSRSILLGFLWSLFFTVLFILFYLEKTPVAARNLKIIASAVAFFLARIYLFSRNLKAYFKEIEF
ncbi:MAG TPA: hypothetical protein GX692_03940 [Acholeplasmataceae bacterium]|nr:hypothetical protein [Acholeplasmataceae bacterium]